ncbi:FHA domain-containing protein [Leucobacter soli]|uniref:FHA domain-containing protein n=1 Tax=Leucobacter soli TaxID=2812850 RepID=UPI0036067898
MGSTTEAEYERLAAEPFAAPPAAPLGAPLAPEPFSWTAASQPSRPEPPASSAPPMHPQASAVRPQAEPAVSEESAPQDPPPPPPVFANDTDALPRLPESDALPPLPSAFSVPPAAPPGRVQDAPSSTSAPASSWADAPPARPAPTPAQAVTRPTGITGVFDAPAAPVPDDGEFDETVVVPRRPTTAWSLVLPDGETFDLGPDTIIGRRPVAADGAETLEIPDPTRTLSKTHVRLRIEDDQPTVEDLGSTNGLLLIHDDGREEDVTPHTRVPATPHMLFGTLQVTLHRLGGAA